MANWSVVVVNEEAAEELRTLTADLRGKFERIVTLIEVKGLEQVTNRTSSTLKGSYGKCA